MPIALPPLPYDYDALEPVISAATLKLHHGAHHLGYVNKLNALVRGTELDALELEDIVKRSARAVAGPAVRAIFNNAAQAWNHAFFWQSLRARERPMGPQGPLKERIAAQFGGLRPFNDAFKSAAAGVFGSGWVWLIADGEELRITATSNADTPIARGSRPLLVLDVWEHAYYLDHQNRRHEYAAGVVDHLLNWDFAQARFLAEEAHA
jgi:Fe-Mn family superoxide dismutase